MAAIFNTSPFTAPGPSVTDYLQSSFFKLNNTALGCLCENNTATGTASQAKPAWGKTAWEIEKALRQPPKDELIEYVKAAFPRLDGAWRGEGLFACSSPYAAWPRLSGGDFKVGARKHSSGGSVRNYIRASSSSSPSASSDIPTVSCLYNDDEACSRLRDGDLQPASSASPIPVPSVPTPSTRVEAITAWLRSKLIWFLSFVCVFTTFLLSVHRDLLNKEQVDNTRLHVQLEVLQERFDDLDAEHDALKASYDAVISGPDVEAENEALRESVHTLEQLYAAEQAHAASLQARNTTLQTRNTSLEAHLADVQTNLRIHLDDLSDHLTNFHDLQTQTTALEQETLTLTTHNTLLSTQNTSLSQSLLTQQSHLTTLEQTNATLSSQIADLQYQHTHSATNWRATLHALESSRAEDEITISSLRASLTAKQEEVDAKQEEVDAKQEEVDAKQEEVDAKHFELKNLLVSSGKQFQRLAEEREERIREVKGELERCTVEMGEWRGLVAEVLEEKGELVGELGWLRYVVSEVGRFAVWESEGFEEEEEGMVVVDGVSDEEEVMMVEESEEGEQGEGSEGDDEAEYLQAVWDEKLEDDSSDEESDHVQATEWDDEGLEEVELLETR